MTSWTSDELERIAAAGGTDHLSVHGFHRSMVVVAVLLLAGGVIAAVGIRNVPMTD